MKEKKMIPYFPPEIEEMKLDISTSFLEGSGTGADWKEGIDD